MNQQMAMAQAGIPMMAPIPMQQCLPWEACRPWFGPFAAFIQHCKLFVTNQLILNRSLAGIQRDANSYKQTHLLVPVLTPEVDHLRITGVDQVLKHSKYTKITTQSGSCTSYLRIPEILYKSNSK